MIQFDNTGLPEGQLSRLQSMIQLPGAVWRDFERLGKKKRYLKNEAICQQGDAVRTVSILLSGRGRIIRTVNSSEANSPALIRLLGPGAVVGFEHALPSQANWNFSFIPLMAIEVINFPVETFLKMTSAHEALRRYASLALCDELRQLQEDRSIQRLSLEARIAFFLTERLMPLSPMRVSRRDIAHWVGASQEAVIRQLSAWSRLGWLSTNNQVILLQTPEKLRSLWSGPFLNGNADAHARPDEPN